MQWQASRKQQSARRTELFCRNRFLFPLGHFSFAFFVNAFISVLSRFFFLLVCSIIFARSFLPMLLYFFAIVSAFLGLRSEAFSSSLKSVALTSSNALDLGFLGFAFFAMNKSRLFLFSFFRIHFGSLRRFGFGISLFCLPSIALGPKTRLSPIAFSSLPLTTGVSFARSMWTRCFLLTSSSAHSTSERILLLMLSSTTSSALFICRFNSSTRRSKWRFRTVACRVLAGILLKSTKSSP